MIGRQADRLVGRIERGMYELGQVEGYRLVKEK